MYTLYTPYNAPVTRIRKWRLHVRFYWENNIQFIKILKKIFERQIWERKILEFSHVPRGYLNECTQRGDNNREFNFEDVIYWVTHMTMEYSVYESVLWGYFGYWKYNWIFSYSKGTHESNVVNVVRKCGIPRLLKAIRETIPRAGSIVSRS